MDSVQTMDLVGTDSGMVPLNNNTEKQPAPVPEVNKISDNNKEEEMDSATPLDEVMGLNDMSNAPLPQDPRMVPQQQAMPQQPVQQAQSQPQNVNLPSKNPMNLTDDQMEALFVGVVAVIAFSKPVQEKLAQMIPQFTAENGSRSTVGIAISGLVAALVYFFGRRFVMKN